MQTARSHALYFLATGMLAVLPPSAVAQTGGVAEPRFDFGLGGGLALPAKKSMSALSTTADAGFKTGYTLQSWLGHDMYDWIGGEVRYEYSRQDLEISGGGKKVGFGGRSHALHYDLIFYGAKPRSRVRPYAFAGGGLKVYEGDGAESAFPPLSEIAVLTSTSQIKGLISFGGGVKFKMSPNVSFRAEFRDNVTSFPDEVIVPTLAKEPGWIHQMMVLFGVAFHF